MKPLITSAGAFFTTYEAIKSGLNKANDSLTGSCLPQPVIHSTASAAAELVSCFILTPAEVLKQNAQMIRHPRDPLHTRQNGWFASSVTAQALKKFKHPSQLWSGYGALASRNLPFTALQFPLFEHLKIKIKTHQQENGTSSGSLLETGVITAVSAGIAGSIAAVITTPIDVIKTHIMLAAANEAPQSGKYEVSKKNGSSRIKSPQENAKKGGMKIAREIYREAGVKGLFRGGTLRATWTSLGSGLYLAVYELGKAWLRDNRESVAI